MCNPNLKKYLNKFKYIMKKENELYFWNCMNTKSSFGVEVMN